MLSLGVAGLFYWMPTFLVRVEGVSEATASSLSGAVGGTGIVVGIVLGSKLGDMYHGVKKGWRINVSVVFLLVGAIGLTGTVLLPGVAVRSAMIALACVGFAAAIPNMTAANADVLPANGRGMGFAVLTFLVTLGGSAGPLLVGFVSTLPGRHPRPEQGRVAPVRDAHPAAAAVHLHRHGREDPPHLRRRRRQGRRRLRRPTTQDPLARLGRHRRRGRVSPVPHHGPAGPGRDQRAGEDVRPLRWSVHSTSTSVGKVCSARSSCTLTEPGIRSLGARLRPASTGAVLIAPASTSAPSVQPPPGPENHTSARVPSSTEVADRVARGSTSRRRRRPPWRR